MTPRTRELAAHLRRQIDEVIGSADTVRATNLCF